MSPKLSLRSASKAVYRWTLLVWGLSVVVHLIWYVIERSSLQTDEVYASGLLFQAAGFAFFRLPYWIAGLVAVLILEFAVVGRKSR